MRALLRTTADRTLRGPGDPGTGGAGRRRRGPPHRRGTTTTAATPVPRHGAADPYADTAARRNRLGFTPRIRLNAALNPKGSA